MVPTSDNRGVILYSEKSFYELFCRSEVTCTWFTKAQSTRVSREDLPAMFYIPSDAANCNSTKTTPTTTTTTPTTTPIGTECSVFQTTVRAQDLPFPENRPLLNINQTTSKICCQSLKKCGQFKKCTSQHSLKHAVQYRLNIETPYASPISYLCSSKYVKI